MKLENNDERTPRQKRGDAIRTFRVQNQYTQAKVAEEVGVGEKQVSKWERGVADPKLDTLPLIANCLGVSIDRIFAYALDKDSNGSTGGHNTKVLADTIDSLRWPACICLAAIGIADYRGFSVLIVTISCLLLFFAVSLKPLFKVGQAMNNSKSNFQNLTYVLYCVLVFACPKLVVESVLLFVATALFLISFRLKKNNYALNVAANLDVREKLMNA